MLGAFFRHSLLILVVSALAMTFRLTTEWCQEFYFHHLNLIYFTPIVAALVGIFGFGYRNSWLLLLLKTNLSQCFGFSTGREFGLIAAARDLSQRLFRRVAPETAMVGAFAACFIAPVTSLFYVFDHHRGQKFKVGTMIGFIYVAFASAFLCSSFFSPIGSSLSGRSFLREASERPDYLSFFPWRIFLTLAYLKFATVALVSVAMFLALLRVVETLRKSMWLWLSLALGSLIVIGLSQAFGLGNYNGLGTTLIDQSTQMEMTDFSFLKKAILTIASRGFGWFGGDFTPLLSIGMSFGNQMTIWSGLGHTIDYALGAMSTSVLFVAARHRLWVTGLILTWELGGLRPAVFVLPIYGACFLVVSGNARFRSR